ncbi:hypothetical protein FRC03_003968 [Tulasnella sp. 419]|nr:hypothetical protein FRC02_001301 [Tulasnella sp. 418]KAG8941794.1 hypothetical protein FRC03_003968 [Tulasnella sp. 419]
MLLRQFLLAIGASLLTIDTVLAVPVFPWGKPKGYERVEADSEELHVIPPSKGIPSYGSNGNSLPLPVSNEANANPDYLLEPEKIPKNAAWIYGCRASNFRKLTEQVTELQYKIKNKDKKIDIKKAKVLVEELKGEALESLKGMQALEAQYKYIDEARKLFQKEQALEYCLRAEQAMESYIEEDIEYPDPDN